MGLGGLWICLAKSRSARTVRLTGHAILGFEVLEKILRGPELPLLRVLQALTNALSNIGTGDDVQQALIVGGVLHERHRPYWFSILR